MCSLDELTKKKSSYQSFKSLKFYTKRIRKKIFFTFDWLFIFIRF